MEITLANIYQLFAESERLRIENERVFNEKIEKLEKERAEREKEREKSRAEGERIFNEKLEKQRISNDLFIKKLSKDLNRKISSLGDIMGLYAQTQIQERIVEMFVQRGIEVTSLSSNYRQEDGKGGFVYEIDLLLYDTAFAIIVEVKHQLKKDDIDEHLERMEKCTQRPPRGTEGKRLLGAVAAMIISQEVASYAQKCGLFIIKPNGKSVKIANPLDFKPQEWPTKV